ncbi:MAG: tRNA preQ1(34) S-adenosylmethionine ribosyltransferase-isomerase QueA [Defluviitaleaceae bacterium]|nr:tRNA preQ1(34) S-adenosylmethionine ribosyltransferase-isomerase QueA [Defluviitaleaceae bacterium]
MNKKDFYYDLPKHLIAQQPTEKRDGSRLMVLNRDSGRIEHRMFTDIVSLLNPGDCIVINDSKVIPARLLSERVELLLHERLEGSRWTALAKPGKRAHVGDTIIFRDTRGNERLTAKVVVIIEGGLRVVELLHEGELEPLLEEIGEMPLPHYIEEKQTDTTRYQTVYAKADDAGASVAAPTAGLHFTEQLLEDIRKKGVKVARVTLHVGIGTFRPVKEDDITLHHMHSEYCRIPPETADIINETKQNGGRVIAVGTTSCRTLESLAGLEGAGKTDIFIYPGYKFKVIDGLLTNFHLPESTLIMLVSALAGRENILAAYRQAVENEYRFFSYGDAMLVL